LFFIIFINNVLLPLSLLPFFKYRNIISSWSVENRKERIIPLLLTTLLYAATSYIVFRFPIPVFLKSFIFASFFLSVIVTIINFWWKISLHSVGVGALSALVLILSLKMHSPLLWYLISIIIIGGLVLSSRLKLNSHNPLQVWIGFLTGNVCLGLFLWFY
jgi:membrane-associated phospholipid phosphatase